MIVRGPRAADNFTYLQNASLRDRRLSFRARGVLVFLLSQPPGYSCSGQQLADEASEGRDAVLTALGELETACYLVRRKFQDEGGRWRNESTVYETPRTGGEPEPGNPDSVGQASKEEGLLEGLTPSVESLTLIDCSVQDDELPFEDFWKRYPRRHGEIGPKAPAAAKWGKLNRSERLACMEAVVNYASEVEARRVLSACHVTTWLNQRRWEQWQVPEDDTDCEDADEPDTPAWREMRALQEHMKRQQAMGPLR